MSDTEDSNQKKLIPNGDIKYQDRAINKEEENKKDISEDFNNKASDAFDSKSNDENVLKDFIQGNPIALIAKTDEEIISQYKDHKPLMNRLFGRMEAGSLRGSIFAISSLALGTGCLALPIRFTQLGLVWALIFLILSSIIAYWSLTLMVKSTIGKTDCYDYSRFVKHTLGKTPAFILDLVIIIYIFGVLISYQVISKYII